MTLDLTWSSLKSISSYRAATAYLQHPSILQQIPTYNIIIWQWNNTTTEPNVWIKLFSFSPCKTISPSMRNLCFLILDKIEINAVIQCFYSPTLGVTISFWAELFHLHGKFMSASASLTENFWYCYFPKWNENLGYRFCFKKWNKMEWKIWGFCFFK